MEPNASKEVVTPYYTMMNDIMTRLEELGKLRFPQYRTHYTQDGVFVTEAVPEYLEQEELIKRWYQLQDYERALEPSYQHNRLLISLNISLAVSGYANASYDPTVAARIAVSVYTNSPCLR